MEIDVERSLGEKNNQSAGRIKEGFLNGVPPVKLKQNSISVARDGPEAWSKEQELQ